MYIKDPNSNKMYAIESAQGQNILRQQKVKPQVDIISTSMQVFNTEPYKLNKEDHVELASGLGLKLNMRMREGTMIRKIHEHIEAGG